jgi:hypothetical protein
MNPQPSPAIGNLVAIALGLLIIYYTIRAIKENKTITINDNFVIGYLESDNIVVNTTPPPKDDFEKPDISPEVPPKPSKKKKIKQEDDTKNQMFYADCIDALVALGMKKREAKNRTQLIFATMHPKPQTIQKFLITALKI